MYGRSNRMEGIMNDLMGSEKTCHSSCHINAKPVISALSLGLRLHSSRNDNIVVTVISGALGISRTADDSGNSTEWPRAVFSGRSHIFSLLSVLVTIRKLHSTLPSVLEL